MSRRYACVLILSGRVLMSYSWQMDRGDLGDNCINTKWRLRVLPLCAANNPQHCGLDIRRKSTWSSTSEQNNCQWKLSRSLRQTLDASVMPLVAMGLVHSGITANNYKKENDELSKMNLLVAVQMTKALVQLEYVYLFGNAWLGSNVITRSGWITKVLICIKLNVITIQSKI